MSGSRLTQMFVIAILLSSAPSIVRAEDTVPVTRSEYVMRLYDACRAESACWNAMDAPDFESFSHRIPIAFMPATIEAATELGAIHVATEREKGMRVSALRLAAETADMNMCNRNEHSKWDAVRNMNVCVCNEGSNCDSDFYSESTPLAIAAIILLVVVGVATSVFVVIRMHHFVYAVESLRGNSDPISSVVYLSAVASGMPADGGMKK